MDKAKLAETARQLVAPGRGILAADESNGTMGKRLKAIGVENTEQNRLGYRETIFTAPGAERHVSGVILYDETIRQSIGGTTVPKLLASKGILPGIKVDTGAKPLALHPDETITEGLDGLRERCQAYVGLGARFAKWRAVVTIGEKIPSQTCLWTNAHALARYAAICQETGLVPIVEPEVLMDGNHSSDRCFDVTQHTLAAVFTELRDQAVLLEGMLLKPNMVIHGQDSPNPADVQTVARRTIECLRRAVPAAVPGIVFLSGGQSDELATQHLDAMNKLGPQPWRLSFSYGRALQHSSLVAWGGKESNREKAQREFLKRAKLNGLAAEGKYDAKMETTT